jgi:hypothetical protein
MLSNAGAVVVHTGGDILTALHGGLDVTIIQVCARVTVNNEMESHYH